MNPHPYECLTKFPHNPTPITTTTQSTTNSNNNDSTMKGWSIRALPPHMDVS